MGLINDHLGEPELEPMPGQTPAAPLMDLYIGVPESLADDIYGIHQILDQFLGPRHSNKYLWAPLRSGIRLGCLVRSGSLPDHLRDKARPVEPPLPGTEVAFNVQASPTFKSKIDSRPKPFDPDNRDGRLRWFQRRAKASGFEIIEVDLIRTTRLVQRKGESFQLDDCEFFGRLVVRDEHKFFHALGSGIGKARTWGFGLLQLGKDGRS